MDRNDNNIYEVIEEYLSGTLSETETVSFEERLKSDNSLQKKVEVCITAKEVILQNKLKDLKSIMAREQIKADQEKPSGNKLWTIIIIASLMVPGAFYLIKKRESLNAETLKAKSAFDHSPAHKPANNTSVQENNIENKSDTEQTVIQKETHKTTLSEKEKTPEIVLSTSSEVFKDNHVNAPDIKSIEPNKAVNANVVNTHTESVDICKGVKITGEISSQEPCNGSHDGTIEVKGLHGGTQPYRSSINGEDHGANYLFEELSPGKYQIEITDFNGCKHQFNPLILKGKVCKLDYDFNPGRGEEWAGPVVQASRLIILDKYGNQVYQKNMADGEQCTWSGYSQTGKLEYGYFIFMVENKDGSVIKGSITVTE